MNTSEVSLIPSRASTRYDVAAKGERMPKWEYRKFETRGNALISVDNEPTSIGDSTDIQQLNAMGQGAWELVSVTLSAAGFSTFYLKRPIS